jgi:hypothetical protein
MTIAAVRLGGTRCPARQVSIFSTNWGSTRMSIFAVFRRMLVKWGVVGYPCLIIRAKKLIRQLRYGLTAPKRSWQQTPWRGGVAAPPVPGAGHRIDRTVAAALD